MPSVVAIITNADDLGRSVGVNEAVFRLVEQGKVTSATLVATGEALADAVARAQAHPDCSYGVHLFLDEFRPVTDLSQFPSVLGSEGNFQSDARRYHYNAALRQALVQEWVAQVGRVRQAGVHVSHLDSHQHIHTFPRVFGMLKQVQKLTGIRKVRCSLNRYLEPKRCLLIAKRLYNTALRYHPATVTTDYFMSFGTFYTLLKEGRLPGAGTYELMVHPGAGLYMAEPGPYEAELAALEGPWEELLGGECRLMTYRELGQSN